MTLRNIPSHISGEISCEITADAPYFSTSCVSSNLTVIELDLDFRISQKTVNNRDIISANCSFSPPSSRVRLSFHLDDREVSSFFRFSRLSGICKKLGLVGNGPECFSSIFEKEENPRKFQL